MGVMIKKKILIKTFNVFVFDGTSLNTAIIFFHDYRLETVNSGTNDSSAMWKNITT